MQLVYAMRCVHSFANKAIVCVFFYSGFDVVLMWCFICVAHLHDGFVAAAEHLLVERAREVHAVALHFVGIADGLQ